MDIKSQADHDVYAVDHDLLNKVVEMQDLLEEYQHTLTELEIEKEDKQQEIDKLDKLLKGKGETEGSKALPLFFFNKPVVDRMFFF